MVGDNNTLECTTTSRQVPLLIQGHMFVTDLFHLPISGVDIVLGVQWLKQLGPITTNYQALPMSFFHSGQSITLIVDVSLDPVSIWAQQLKRCAQTQSISTLFSLTPIPTQPSPSSSSSHLHESPLPLQITSIITQFPEIFREPDKLPPTWTIQHHIHLVPNTNPVNVKSYRYPHFQKTKLEQQVASMLNAGLIQPNHNMFSSSVLIVKKKDSSWHYCVNYKALNAVMIKDHFPMPTIDKLLDELGHASWFSKLDLR